MSTQTLSQRLRELRERIQTFERKMAESPGRAVLRPNLTNINEFIVMADDAIAQAEAMEAQAISSEARDLAIEALDTVIELWRDELID